MTAQLPTAADAPPEVGALVADLTQLWSDHGYQIVLGALATVAAILAASLWYAHRNGHVPRWVANMTGILVLAVSAEGMWEVATQTLELPGGFAVAVFFFAEAMMLSSAIQARYHYQKHKHPGKHGTAVWVIAASTGIVVAFNATTKVEFVLRLLLPLGAAYQWWNSLTAEGTERPKGTWRWTPRRLLMHLGAIEAKAADVEQLDTERRVRVMTSIALSVHRKSRPRWWWAWRLERLAMAADEPLIAAVHERVRRVDDIRNLTAPGRPVALEDRLHTFQEEVLATVRGELATVSEGTVRLAEETAVQAAERISAERADHFGRRAVQPGSAKPVQPTSASPVHHNGAAPVRGQNGAGRSTSSAARTDLVDSRPPNAVKMNDDEAVEAMLAAHDEPGHVWTQRAVRDLTGAGPDRIRDKLLPRWKEAAVRGQAARSKSPVQNAEPAGAGDEPSASSAGSPPAVRPDRTAPVQPAPADREAASSLEPVIDRPDREPVPVAAL